MNTLTGHTELVRSLAHILNTKFILSGSDDNSIKIWNYETYELVQTLTGHTDTVRSIVYIPNTKYIVSGSLDKTIKIWNY